MGNSKATSQKYEVHSDYSLNDFIAATSTIPDEPAPDTPHDPDVAYLAEENARLFMKNLQWYTDAINNFDTWKKKLDAKDINLGLKIEKLSKRLGALYQTAEHFERVLGPGPIIDTHKELHKILKNASKAYDRKFGHLVKYKTEEDGEMSIIVPDYVPLPLYTFMLIDAFLDPKQLKLDDWIAWS